MTLVFHLNIPSCHAINYVLLWKSDSSVLGVGAFKTHGELPKNFKTHPTFIPSAIFKGVMEVWIIAFFGGITCIFKLLNLYGFHMQFSQSCMNEIKIFLWSYESCRVEKQNPWNTDSNLGSIHQEYNHLVSGNHLQCLHTRVVQNTIPHQGSMWIQSGWGPSSSECVAL